MSISERLVELRKGKKLTQTEVAKELGVSLRSYSRWENGINVPGKAAIQKLSDFYGEDLIAEISTAKMSDAPANVVAKDGEKTKKPAGRKARKVEPKKPAPKKDTPKKETAEKTSDINAELQYAGKAIQISEIFNRARQACGNKADKIDIYIKPEENRVYFVSDGNEGSFEI